jgi:hypothetical protein
MSLGLARSRSSFVATSSVTASLPVRASSATVSVAMAGMPRSFSMTSIRAE